MKNSCFFNIVENTSRNIHRWSVTINLITTILRHEYCKEVQNQQVA